MIDDSIDVSLAYNLQFPKDHFALFLIHLWSSVLAVQLLSLASGPHVGISLNRAAANRFSGCSFVADASSARHLSGNEV